VNSVIDYSICCDSADLYAWVLKNTNYEYVRNLDYTRSISLQLDGTDVRINFVHRVSNKKMYDQLTNRFLSNTAGTPDYVLFKKTTPIVCIEDSKTAPVGNAVIQRLDKLWPLLLDDNIECPIIYIGPREGLDVSQNKMRGWPQSWFYKNFAKDRPDAFLLLDNEASICERVFSEIISVIKSDIKGERIAKQKVTTNELKRLHSAMSKNIRTYSNGIFRGKLFKPDGTDAHPVQSTLMVISETRAALKLSPIKIKLNNAHRQKLLNSKSKRVVRVMKQGPVLS
tara:strand:- start:11466 stop:12314 length:849 start_codon:yes stop_codon:yes gene_type:complete